MTKKLNKLQKAKTVAHRISKNKAEDPSYKDVMEGLSNRIKATNKQNRKLQNESTEYQLKKAKKITGKVKK